MRTISILVVALLSSFVVRAQMTLSDDVESVVEYSNTLKSSEAMVESRAALYEVAKRNLLPDISLSSETNMNFKDADIGWGVSANITQPLYNGGRYRALAEQGEQALLKSESMLNKQRMDIVYSAEVTYWRLSRALVYRDAMHDYINIIKMLRDVALHRFEEGYTSKSDLLQVESRLLDAEYLLSEAEQSWSVALHNFNVLRGAEPDTDIELRWSILDEYALPLRADISAIVELHPDYIIAVAEQETAQLNIIVERANYLPKLGGGVFGVWQPGLGTTKQLNGGVTLSLSTPIFNFGERKEAMRSAQSQYRNAKYLLQEVVDEITLNESNGWTNLQLSHQRIGSTRRSLEIAGENLDISTYSYREGLATILDVLQAQLSWLQIYQNAIAAQYDYVVAISAYRYIIAQE